MHYILLFDTFVVSTLLPTKSCVSWFQLHFKAHWLFWWITRKTKHTSHVICFSKVLWFKENAEQATCHLSVHLKTRLAIKPAEAEAVCTVPTHTVCLCIGACPWCFLSALTIYLIFAEWLRSCLACGPLRVQDFCSPLPRHLCVFDRCPWCWTAVWVKAGVIWMVHLYSHRWKWGT